MKPVGSLVIGDNQKKTTVFSGGRFLDSTFLGGTNRSRVHLENRTSKNTEQDEGRDPKHRHCNLPQNKEEEIYFENPATSTVLSEEKTTVLYLLTAVIFWICVQFRLP